MTAAVPGTIRRPLFVLTILAGSFLLFLVQPMVARMALPRLGGAPNVWNSAMLVYQALLLAGYGYAHWLSHMPIRRQAMIHVGLLLLAALTLPIALADLPAPAPGSEAWWVPLLFLLTIGPVFFLVSAQAPLMQRWFSAHPGAGAPWALYAASNLGSFAGLIAYPLAAEPLLRLRAQSLGWSLGYGLLIVLIAFAAAARWHAVPLRTEMAEAPPPLPLSRILLWLALSAVPSGLMLSTTTHLTTDIFAMPLLWVIPLGVYLFSFVFAFSDRRGTVRVLSALALPLMLLVGGMAMVSRGSGSLAMVLASVALLLTVCTALHGRLYDARPAASQLTLFYLVMSAGGALGGLFTALIAPLVFDWVWEHPILVFAAAALLPAQPWLDWRRMPGLSAELVPAGLAVLLGFAAFLCWQLYGAAAMAEPGAARLWLTGALAACGLLLAPWRPAMLALLAGLMLAQGGLETVRSSLAGARTRSYFGVYTVRDYPAQHLRTLAHGTTLHGEQSTDPLLRRLPITYYGPGSGAGIAFANAQALLGPRARIGVVGLGTGTLACYHRAGEDWRFFEIDPAVLEFSRAGTFTYVRDCAPDARVVLGDARLALRRMPRGSIDLLAIDAFSSDAIPLHLLTDEAFAAYFDALSPRGLLLVHISNRYIELEPVLAAQAAKRGLTAALRDDNPPDNGQLTASSWVLMTRDPAQLAALRRLAPALAWTQLMPPAPRAWSDDHASILPYIRWHNLLRTP